MTQSPPRQSVAGVPWCVGGGVGRRSGSADCPRRAVHRRRHDRLDDGDRLPAHPIGSVLAGVSAALTPVAVRNPETNIFEAVQPVHWDPFMAAEVGSARPLRLRLPARRAGNPPDDQLGRRDGAWSPKSMCSIEA